MRRGFTLIESLVSLVLANVLFFVFAFFIREGFDAWAFTRGQNFFFFSGRSALNRITRDIKLMKDNTSISVFTSTEVRFLDENDNTINFYQNAINLMRNQDIILENLELPGGLNITYLDSGGTPTSFKSQIRSIRVMISAENDENKLTIESSAGIRNGE